MGHAGTCAGPRTVRPSWQAERTAGVIITRRWPGAFPGQLTRFVRPGRSWRVLGGILGAIPPHNEAGDRLDQLGDGGQVGHDRRVLWRAGLLGEP